MAIIVSVVLASERPRPDARAYTPSPPRALASHVRLRGAHDTQLHVESPRSRPSASHVHARGQQLQQVDTRASKRGGEVADAQPHSGEGEE